MNGDPDGLKNFEGELIAALSRIEETDLSAAQKREIIRLAKLPHKSAANRAVWVCAAAVAACAALAAIVNLSWADENFSLDDIIIAGEVRAGQPPPRAEIFWRKAMEAGGDLRVQEEYALACVYGDFEGDTPANGPLRKVEGLEARAVMVLVK